MNTAAKDKDLGTITVLRHMMGMKALLERMSHDNRIPLVYRKAAAFKAEMANELADWLYTGGCGNPPSPWDALPGPILSSVQLPLVPPTPPVKRAGIAERKAASMQQPVTVRYAIDKPFRNRNAAEFQFRIETVRRYLLAHEWSTVTEIWRGCGASLMSEMNVVYILQRLDLKVRGFQPTLYALYEKKEEAVSA